MHTQRIAAVDLAATSGKTREHLDAFGAKLGLIPQMVLTMAQAPAVLDGYVALSGALGRGTLGAKLGELVATTVAETNGCTYCLGAHYAIGKLVGVAEEALAAARHATSPDPRTAAALTFVRRVTEARGHVTEADVATVRAAGFSEGQVGELVAHVALNILTNYFNLVANTEVDLPLPAEAGS